ncbi:hypothetical protein [Burkholderia anthina]|uniref:hypothetical protein n=1 Tax=Burkholderia anthina TaxID=179879 RepID=UPI001AA09266|nr:hypothetical protein [Burkholderia anthina]QTD88750.1 hypothetical protein J4G50_13065 [Burkholderia anthina]
MAKQPTAPTAQTKQTPADGAGDGKDVNLNTGADSKPPEGDTKPPADAGGDTKPTADDAAKNDSAVAAAPAPDDATLADVGEAAADGQPAAAALASTLSEHVANLLATAEKSGDTASQSVMNRIHVKLAEFRHMITSIEQHVLDAAHADVQELVDDMKRLF